MWEPARHVTNLVHPLHYEQRVVRVLHSKNHNFHANVYHRVSNNRARVNQLPCCPHVRVMQSLFPWSVYLGRVSENMLLTMFMSQDRLK